MNNPYDKRYDQDNFYWGYRPSSTCYRVLKLLPPEKPLRLLDVGCGEGRNAVFFARSGYKVTAFDLSPKGVEKTKKFADKFGVSINVFEADLLKYRVQESYDIIFSTGVFHYIPPKLRTEILTNYMRHTAHSGLNVFSVFVKKPFIPKAPDAESTANHWKSGELFTHYHEWLIEYCTEEIFDCNSSGIPHKHATNRIIARKV
jgi:tellurite methyltransferase